MNSRGNIPPDILALLGEKTWGADLWTINLQALYDLVEKLYLEGKWDVAAKVSKIIIDYEWRNDTFNSLIFAEYFRRLEKIIELELIYVDNKWYDHLSEAERRELYKKRNDASKNLTHWFWDCLQDLRHRDLHGNQLKETLEELIWPLKNIFEWNAEKISEIETLSAWVYWILLEH